MSRFVRATGLSVAAVTLAVGLVFSGPTRAETEEAPTAVRYIDHSNAMPLLSTGTLEGVESGAEDSQFSSTTPIFQHAVATTEVEPVAAAETETESVEAQDEPSRPQSLSDMVSAHMSSDVPDAETECLAIAIYYESKSEPLAGQLAVGEVIVNRARSGRFPSSLCGVVKQRGQFSFVRGGRLPAVPRGSLQWKKAVAIAHIVRNDMADSDAPRALFFHARHVSPRWKLTRVASVGNHIFYR